MSPSDIRTILYRLDQQDQHLQEIKTQVKATNGRVSKLELWQARLDGAKWAVSWLPSLVTALAGGGVGAVLASVLS